VPEFTYEAIATTGQRSQGNLTANSEREVLVPVIEDVVKAMDFAARRVTIEPIPGLLD